MISPKKLTTSLFVISIVVMLVGSVMKLMHLQWSNQIFTLGGLIYILFVFYCLAEIWASKKIRTQEKIIWLIFLFLVPIITGLIYIFSSREKIV